MYGTWIVATTIIWLEETFINMNSSSVSKNKSGNDEYVEVEGTNNSRTRTKQEGKVIHIRYGPK